MGTFKAGDRVRIIAATTGIPHQFDIGSVQTVTEVFEDGSGIQCGKWACSFDEVELLPVAGQQAGPVRTVTRREIVPGVYGARGEVTVGKAGTSTMVKITIDSPMSKNHLREAAHLFNQMAEVLEEG